MEDYKCCQIHDDRKESIINSARWVNYLSRIKPSSLIDSLVDLIGIFCLSKFDRASRIKNEKKTGNAIR